MHFVEQHVRGASQFIDDCAQQQDEWFVGIVTSPHAHAKIEAIDGSKLQQLPVESQLFTAADLQHNAWGTIIAEQPLLAQQLVRYAGEAVALVAVKDRIWLTEALQAVEVTYTPLPAVLSISAARKRQAFVGPTREIRRGEVEPALESAYLVCRGVLHLAGQEHFYLESQAARASWVDGRKLQVMSSSQHPSETQHVVAHALGLPLNSVMVTVPRMGGGFGGKESQAAPIAAYAALVAWRNRSCARVIVDKDTDMHLTGKRNPFEIHYQAGFTADGKITSLKAQLFSDSGAYADLSTAIMERALLHSDNAYFIPHVHLQGTVCTTNYAPNTAFRGFGGPKGVCLIECILEEAAHKLGIEALELRQMNLYQTGQTTPYGQEITDSTKLTELYHRLRESSDYQKRRQQIDTHNQSGADTLRGLAMTGVKFGISFTTRFLNQGGAVVHILLDGSIQVATGATEMGQGVEIKIAHIVAETFGLPLESIEVLATSTDKIPNTSPTAASSGADINGGAALIACQELKQRLAKVCAAVLARPKELRGRMVAATGLAAELEVPLTGPAPAAEFKDGQVWLCQSPQDKISFVDLIQEAYLNRVCLWQQGFFKYPGIHFNKETGKGEPFRYFTQGVAVSEVSIDRFTGEVKVMDAQILMDLGRPLHRGTDYGQTCGAFIQGLGWVLLEKLHYENGVLLSHSPSTYKIPSIQDIPRQLKIDFVEGDNKVGLRGSKAVGEPPLLLGISVFAAVKNALYGLATESGDALSLPASGEEIARCLDLGRDH